MSVSNVGGATAAAQLLAAASQSNAAPSPRNDGDGDAGDAPKVQASPPPGTGKSVDKTA